MLYAIEFVFLRCSFSQHETDINWSLFVKLLNLENLVKEFIVYLKLFYSRIFIPFHCEPIVFALLRLVDGCQDELQTVKKQQQQEMKQTYMCNAQWYFEIGDDLSTVHDSYSFSRATVLILLLLVAQLAAAAAVVTRIRHEVFCWVCNIQR